MSETQLSASIRSALERLGVWCMRVNSGGYRSRSRGAPKGTPDILLIGPATVAGSWLEVKDPNGKNRDEASQPIWHQRAKKMGVRVAVVRSVAEALEAVRGWSGGSNGK